MLRLISHRSYSSHNISIQSTTSQSMELACFSINCIINLCERLRVRTELGDHGVKVISLFPCTSHHDTRVNVIPVVELITVRKTLVSIRSEGEGSTFFECNFVVVCIYDDDLDLDREQLTASSNHQSIIVHLVKRFHFTTLT